MGHDRKRARESDEESTAESTAEKTVENSSSGESDVKKPGLSRKRMRKNADNESYVELDSKKRVTVRTFKGKTYIDIREMYEKDGKMLPSKKGISLTPELWNELKANMDAIDGAIAELK